MREGLRGAEARLAAIRLGQCGHRFDLRHRAGGGVVGENSLRHGHFVVHEDELAARMKREMARTAASGRFGKRRLVRREFAAGGIDFVDKHFVQAEVAGEGEAIVRAEIHAVRMRAGLALWIDAAAFMLDEAGGLAQFAIGTDRVGGDAAAAVVRQRGHFACGIDIHMTRAAADGAGLIDERELAALRINGEGTDAAAFFAICTRDVADGEEKFFRRMNRQEAGIARFSGDFGLRERAAAAVETCDVDAFAAVLGIRVGSKVNEVVVTRVRCSGGEKTESGGDEERAFHGARMLTERTKTVKHRLHTRE